jgi:hypothetical protein
LHQRAESEALHKFLFKGRVQFVAVNCDANAHVAAGAIARWPSAHMTHLHIDEQGIQACKVQFVPQRALVAPNGAVVEWWDGSHGNVVDGRHGKSRANASTKLADKIAAVLEKY